MAVVNNLGGRRGAPPRRRKQRVPIKPGIVLAAALVLVVVYSVFVFNTLSSVGVSENENTAGEQASSKNGRRTAKATEATKTKTDERAPPSSGTEPGAAAASAGGGAPPDLSEQGAVKQPNRRRRRRSDLRFPRFGTDEFESVCSWTAAPAATPLPGKDCAFMVRPMPKSNEGLASWAGFVASAVVLILQTGCQLLIDYGPGVDVGAVLAPQPETDGFPLLNWSVPEGYGNCTLKKHCRGVSDNYKRSHTEKFARSMRHMIDRPPLVPSPKYRFLYKTSGTPVNTADVDRDLGLSLPGFKTESGMACALERIFQLAPSASRYSEGLFDRILPAVRDEDALVIALYIRTGRTDKVSAAEEEGKAIGEDRQSIGGRTLPQRAVDRAIDIEGVLLATESHSRVVWMIVTDSPNAKKLIVKAYDGKMATASGSCVRDAGAAETPVSVPRTVLATSARGVQTKPKRGPSTADFAEAFLDWYLVGESDVVITAGGISFGSTGALRTARPIISGVQNCTLEVASFG